MIRFHPDENMLVEYTAGSLSTALAIAVKAHLQMCSVCRERVSQLNMLGSVLLTNSEIKDELEESPTNGVDDPSVSFGELMAKIKLMEGQPLPQKLTNQNRNTSLPSIVERLLPDKSSLAWRRVSPSLKQANLQTGQAQFEVCLHKICKGGTVAHHDHRGMEVTLVLKGAFSDEDGSYKEGDFLVRQPGEKHRPCATQNQDCLCLSVVEAPVKLTGLLGTVINPFLSFRPG